MSLVKHISPVVLREQGIDLQVGDILINHSSYNRIVKIESLYENERDGTPYLSYRTITDWAYTKWSDRVENLSIKEFMARGYAPLERGVSLEDHVKEALQVISGEKSVSEYADKASDNLESETALVSSGSKTSLIALQNDLTIKQQKAELLRQFVGL